VRFEKGSCNKKQTAHDPKWSQFAKLDSAQTNNPHCKSLEGTWHSNWKYLDAK